MDRTWLKTKPEPVSPDALYEVQPVFTCNIVFDIYTDCRPLLACKVWASFVQFPPFGIRRIKDLRERHQPICIVNCYDVVASTLLGDLGR